MFENIPNSIKFNALWCCWKLTDRGKVPFDSETGEMAKSNDSSTFHTFKTVLNNLHKYLKIEDNKFLGGLGLGIFNGYSAIDIDDCVKDGEISEMAQEIIDYCQSYTEYSPSGKGIRIIFKTDFKNFDKAKYYTNNRKIGLEIYIEGVTSKFVTMTGNTLLSCDVVNVDIEYILNKYMLKKQTETPINNNEVGKNIYKIEDFIEKDVKLHDLWNSVASGSGGNESETDMALCCKLAFYLQRDPQAIKEAFEKSPYYASKDSKHIKKWNSHTYAADTINKAIQLTTDVYKRGGGNKKQYGLNDTGNAHRFVDKYGNGIKYNVDSKMWMQWNGTNWQYDVFNNVKNLAEILTQEMEMECFQETDEEKRKEMVKNVQRLYSTKGKESMLKESQHLIGIPVNTDMFDKNDYLLNTENGVIDLRSGKSISHNRNLLLNKKAGANITKDKPVNFLKFFSEMFKNNTDVMRYLHKFFGYCLTGDCSEQVMVILVGDGNDGKSLLLQIIQEVIGEYSATSSPELLLEKKTQTQNLSEVARLKGIRFCVVNELKLGDKLNESGVKDITSGNNKIVARFLYANEFEFLPKMKLILATNYLPVVRGTDKGIWRRLIKINCPNSLSEDQTDKHLIDKLRLEKDAILTWLIQGCMMWQKEGLKLPECLVEEKKEYREDMDLVQKWINEYCIVNSNLSETSTNLYDSFKNYCVKNGEYVMSQTLFGRNFGKKFEKIRSGGVTRYKGIEVRNRI